MVDFHSAIIQQSDQSDPAVEDVSGEILRLYDELSARLEARGVTPEEMQAAVDAGDADRVRELFGYTPEEYAQQTARLLALAEAIRRGHGHAPPQVDGLECDWEIMKCGADFVLAAAIQPQWALGLFVGGAVVCALSECRWRDGSGPRTKQP